jgi:Lrp/AsnC family transcriptional regulator for asnA, asnC and gidA
MILFRKIHAIGPLISFFDAVHKFRKFTVKNFLINKDICLTFCFYNFYIKIIFYLENVGGVLDKTVLDALDNEIIRLLTEDGRMSIGELAKKLNVTAPTIRSRIKNLEEKDLFKVSGLFDPSRHKDMITALVAMSVRSEGKLDYILDKIALLPNVAWAGVVTGRYDIIAEVICVEGKEELYRFTTETILKMGNIVRSETFILMRSKNNWLRLPKGAKEL